jgi:hypothetical protein
MGRRHNGGRALKGGAPWYAGRIVRQRGVHGTVDVLAQATASGWEAIKRPRKLFPKSGQVELLSSAASTLRLGDWLTFQITSPRSEMLPEATPIKIGAHRVLPRYVDMASMGSIAAAYVLFTKVGWLGGRQGGHWAVRFAPDGILVLDLGLERGGRLRVSAPTLQHVQYFEFDAHRVTPEPGIEHPAELYDLGDIKPLGVLDWSPDADYIAHVVHSLAGADDPRLGDLIAWLELHRDENTGQVSTTHTDHQMAFQAVRSGELAVRLSADKALMAAYLAAVRDDPAVAQAVTLAASQLSADEREAVIAALRSELTSTFNSEKARQDTELKNRESHLEEALQSRIRQQTISLEKELETKSAAAAREIEARVVALNKAIEAEMAGTIGERNALLSERDKLQSEKSFLVNEVATLAKKRHTIEDEVNRLSVTLAALTQRTQTSGQTLVHLPTIQKANATAVVIEQLAAEISRTNLLTDHGKILMEDFVTFILSGELPILEGKHADDFALVAEALLAAGGLIPFSTDSTVLTPEDIWSRPGSSIESPVAQAANLAQKGERTFLVQLKEIERSAARLWYPALASLMRRGLFPRRLLVFATIADTETEEAQALPGNACRMVVEGAIAAGAALVAPSILGTGPSSTAFQLDPGQRPSDLSSALSMLPELGMDIDISTSLRVARVAVEASRLRPDRASVLAAARRFCRATQRTPSTGYDIGRGAENA